MDRLLVLRLRSSGVAAEAWLNGVPLLRTPRTGGDASMPVHEFVVPGDNRLELWVEPPPPGAVAAAPAPVFGDGQAHAGAALLLPRMGQPAADHGARVLGQVGWASPDGELWRPPLQRAESVDIPVRFPRWRWLDAPKVAEPDTLRAAAATWLQDQAVALARGDADALVSAAKLRFEELALAYQRQPADDVARWRSRVQLLHAQKLRPELPTPESLWLRPVAEGRLLDCLGLDGLPALRCQRPDGARLFWPVRLAAVERRLYPLR
ncbi:hypothetical protein [Pseudorhodoferax sp.]|uniref:hypothetical protein n=1 Tax=Pseudorhodoferax sp. TaxID=1993553 RepID=UPI002DD6496A|nr:hypothetical protein [Pseudorhodoferax sp.]